MSAPTRVYRVDDPNHMTRLVRAAHPAAAIRHCYRDVTASVATQDDLVELLTGGIVVEDVGEASEEGSDG